MKKLFLFLVIGIGYTINGFAQIGVQSIGGNLGFQASVEGYGFPGIGAKYQYQFDKHFRIEPSFTYYFGVNDRGRYEKYYEKFGYEWIGNVNLNYIITTLGLFRPYIAVGVGVGSIHESEYIDEGKCMKAGGVLGVGVDYRLNRNMVVQLEAKGLLSGDHYWYNCNAILVNLGFIYNL